MSMGTSFQKQNARLSSTSQLRHRHGGRRPSVGPEDDRAPPQRLRRSSTLSDTITEARHSLRTTTDDLFLPRADPRGEIRSPEEESLLQSAPLVLALLPALGGIFFENGSVFLTDVSLLALAAIFLNWSFRLPWEWYQSARQAVYSNVGYEDSVMGDIPETVSTEKGNRDELSHGEASAQKPIPLDAKGLAARRELERHELMALISCFIFPLVGAWLLHTIRAQLSRPSEGLVSNYNLTIFLLAAEIRPFHHLLKLVQAKTLHLQRVVSLRSSPTDIHTSRIADLAKRIEELEARIASHTYREPPRPEPTPPKGKEKEANLNPTDIIREVRSSIQPDLESLARAVRRHERRSVLWSAETETRIENLEVQLREAFSVAEYTRRHHAAGTATGPISLIWSAALLPLRFLWAITCLPARTAAWCFGSRGNTVQSS